MKVRVVIVGGGVMGVSIAWHAARRFDPIDEPVVLLEKTTLGAGSSGRSGAILRQHYSDRVVAAMARDSLRVYAGFEAQTARSIGFQRMGVITLAGADRPADIELVRKNVVMQQEIGIDTRLVDAAQIRALAPGITVREGTVGAYEPGGGGVDPLRTVEAFAALARESGASVRPGTRVTRIDVRGGRVRGVDTDHGYLEAEQVVVASGPWSRALCASLDLELPLQVLRPEQHFVTLPPSPALAMQPEATARASDLFEDRFAPQRLPPAAHPVLLDLEHGFYTRCEGHAARTRVGKMDYHGDHVIEDPDALDEHVGDEFRRWARAKLESRLPVYRDQRDAGDTVGMYTVSPDAQALIGPVQGIEGLFLVTGFSGHGFKLAPSVGEGVTQMLRGEPVSAFDVEFFAPDRFASAEKRELRAFGL